MSYTNRYIPGDRLLHCYICGFDYRLSDMRKIKWPIRRGNDTSAPARSSSETASYLSQADNPEGPYVCPKCFDGMHPRDKTPKLRPAQSLRWPR